MLLHAQISLVAFVLLILLQIMILESVLAFKAILYRFYQIFLKLISAWKLLIADLLPQRKADDEHKSMKAPIDECWSPILTGPIVLLERKPNYLIVLSKWCKLLG